MIRRLSPQIAALIAAGEVIHSPRDVLKELVENAIDAGASEINISLKYGGIEQIIVQDNGVGIAPDELSLALERHATSKICTIDDLARHSFYGFRGEGLYSIAAVSNFTLRSRRKSDLLGSQISIVLPDRCQKLISVPMDYGTVVQCDQLFAPMPVRRKLLKSPRVELRRSLEMIRDLVLIHQSISVRVIERGEALLVLKGDENGFDTRLAHAFPDTVRSKWTCFKKEIDQGTIKAWYYQGATKGLEQIWYVNQRWFTQSNFHKLLSSHVSEGIVIVKMNLKAECLDINLHPQKHQFGFYYQDSLLSSLADFFWDWLGKDQRDTVALDYQDKKCEKTTSYRGSNCFFEHPVVQKTPSSKNMNTSDLSRIEGNSFPVLFLDKNCAIFSQDSQFIMINPFILYKTATSFLAGKKIIFKKNILAHKKTILLDLGWLEEDKGLLWLPEKDYSEELYQFFINHDSSGWIDFYRLIESHVVDFIIQHQGNKGFRWIFEQDFFIFHQKTKDFIAPFLKSET